MLSNNKQRSVTLLGQVAHRILATNMRGSDEMLSCYGSELETQGKTLIFKFQLVNREIKNLNAHTPASTR